MRKEDSQSLKSDCVYECSFVHSYIGLMSLVFSLCPWRCFFSLVVFLYKGR